jgi:transposase
VARGRGFVELGSAPAAFLLWGDVNQTEPKPGFRWTTQRHKAALLLAENELSDREIAATLKISRTTLHNWKQDADFAAQVGDHIGEIKARMMRRAIARKEHRIEVLDRLHTKLLTVVEERGAELAGESAGTDTGLVVRQIKQIGSGRDAQTVEEFAVDTGTIREIRALHEQAAKELGQWIDKSQVEDVTRVVEIVGIEADAI